MAKIVCSPSNEVNVKDIIESVNNLYDIVNSEIVNRKLEDNKLWDAINVVSESLPIGTITIFSGSFSDIPSGWFLCNGANGTPNLVDKFIYGASVENDIGNTGGSADATLPSHLHYVASHTHSIDHGHTGGTTGNSGNHFHGTSWGEKSGYGSGRHGVYSSTPGVGSGSTDEDNVEYKTSTDGNHNHSFSVPNFSGQSGGSSPAVSSTGSDGTGKNIPPYVKLAFIMRVS